MAFQDYVANFKKACIFDTINLSLVNSGGPGKRYGPLTSKRSGVTSMGSAMFGGKTVKKLLVWGAVAGIFAGMPATAQETKNRTLKTKLVFSEASFEGSSFDNLHASITYSLRHPNGIADHFTVSNSKMDGDSALFPDVEDDVTGFEYMRSAPLKSEGLSYWVGASYGSASGAIDGVDLGVDSFSIFAGINQAIPLDEVSGVNLSGGARHVWRSTDPSTDASDLTIGYLAASYVRLVGEASFAKIGLLGQVANEAITLADDDQVASVTVGFDTPLGGNDSPYRATLDARIDVTGSHNANAIGITLARSF